MLVLSASAKSFQFSVLTIEANEASLLNLEASFAGFQIVQLSTPWIVLFSTCAAFLGLFLMDLSADDDSTSQSLLLYFYFAPMSSVMGCIFFKWICLHFGQKENPSGEQARNRTAFEMMLMVEALDPGAVVNPIMPKNGTDHNSRVQSVDF